MTSTETVQQLLPVGSRPGPVHLRVTDINRAQRFWVDTLGLSRLADGDNCDDGSRHLGDATGRPLVALIPGANQPVGRGVTGLYHVALHFESRREFARAITRLVQRRVAQAPTDHLVSEATYLSDPDGHGIELTFETPHRGELRTDGRRYHGVTADGRWHSGRDALDVPGVLAELDGQDGPPDLDAPLTGVRVGHVHLHVRDLDEARSFYRDVIGLHDMLHMPTIGMSDFGIDQPVPHSLAINTWAGRGASSPPDDAAGLAWFTLHVPAASDLDAIAVRLRDARVAFERANASLDARDPSGNRLRIETFPTG